MKQKGAKKRIAKKQRIINYDIQLDFYECKHGKQIKNS